MATDSDMPSNLPSPPIIAAWIYLSILTPLLLLTTTVVAFRIHTRRHSVIGICRDDWVIIAAFAFAVLDWTVMAASVGTVIDVGKSISLAQALSMASLSVVAAVSTACAVACVKASVGFSLLRLQNHTRWKWFLWPMIILQGVIAAFQTIMMTTRCIPLEGVWNPNVAAKCWDVNVFRISFTVSSILVILTDIIFSLAPLSFIFRIRASWRQKLAIGILMAAGLFASAASIAKTLAIQSFGSSGNPAATGIKVAVWASVEGQVGIIVASLPCLKATLERMCIRFRSAEKLDTRTEDLAVHNGTVYLG